MAGKFELKKAKNDQYYFVLKAGNGEPILTASEMYVQKQSALNGITAVKSAAPHDKYYDRKQSGTQHYFILKAINFEPVGKSEMYQTPAGRDNGIESVKTNAPTAKIEDLT